MAEPGDVAMDPFAERIDPVAERTEVPPLFADRALAVQDQACESNGDCNDGVDFRGHGGVRSIASVGVGLCAPFA